MRTATSKLSKPSSKASIQKPAPQKAVPAKKIIAIKTTKSIRASKPIITTAPALPIFATIQKPNKQSQLINLLSQPQGASLKDLIMALGWQSHSIRGIISGVLRKKLGLNVVRLTLNGACVYQILPKA